MFFVACVDSLNISGGTSKKFCGNEASLTFVPYTSIVILTLISSGKTPPEGFRLTFTSFSRKLEIVFYYQTYLSIN